MRTHTHTRRDKISLAAGEPGSQGKAKASATTSLDKTARKIPRTARLQRCGSTSQVCAGAAVRCICNKSFALTRAHPTGVAFNARLCLFTRHSDEHDSSHGCRHQAKQTIRDADKSCIRLQPSYCTPPASLKDASPKRRRRSILSQSQVIITK